MQSIKNSTYLSLERFRALVEKEFRVSILTFSKESIGLLLSPIRLIDHMQPTVHNLPANESCKNKFTGQHGR